MQTKPNNPAPTTTGYYWLLVGSVWQIVYVIWSVANERRRIMQVGAKWPIEDEGVIVAWGDEVKCPYGEGEVQV